MKTSKLGISVGLMAAAVYFLGLFGGYIPAVLLTGYILICEENEWLKRVAVKAVILMVVFSAAICVLNFIPNIMSIISNLLSVIRVDFYLYAVSDLISAATGALSLLEKVLFLYLGASALKQSSMPIPVVEGILNKYM